MRWNAFGDHRFPSAKLLDCILAWLEILLNVQDGFFFISAS
jgi:hypothetical protein